MYDDVPFVVLWKNPKNSPDAFQDKILRPVIIKKFAKKICSFEHGLRVKGEV